MRYLRSSQISYAARDAGERTWLWASPMSKAAGGFLRAAAVPLVAVAMCPVCTALAAPPKVKIESPLNGRETNQTPSFSGLAEAGAGEVTVRIYAGTVAAGTVIQELSTLVLS